MLNAELVENFHGIFRQKQTGSLTVSGDEFNMRFFFQLGEVMAMDLGEDKEHLLADKLKEYHRLDAAQHTLVFANREKVQGTVAEIVRTLRLASDDEIAQSTRAMVEDALCGVFAADIRHLQFNPLQGIESFNFERSAVRLRIPVETLLKTVDHRVTEIQEVHRAVKDWDVVFAFAEGSDGASALTDFEKHVLNFVDGHRSVEEIGNACRDSSLNLARVLNGLAKKGVVRKQPPRVRNATGVSPVVRTGSISPDAAGHDESQAVPVLQPDLPDHMERPVGHASAAASAAAAVPLQVPTYATLPRQVEPESSGWFLRFALLALLAVVVVLGVMVYNGKKRQEAFHDKQLVIDDMVTHREWSEAVAKLDDLATDAKGDVEETAQVDDLKKQFQNALESEYAKIAKLMTQREFSEANGLLVRLPASLQKDQVANQLHASEEDFNAVSNKLANDVSADLDNGDIQGANRLIAGHDRQVAANAFLVRDRWRIRKIEEASAQTTSIEDRQHTLKLVHDASPADAPLTENQQQAVGNIEADIRRQEGRLRDEIKTLQDLADKGDFETALAKAKDLGTATVVKGNSELVKSFQAFQATCDKVKDEFEQFSDDLKQALTNSDSIDPLTKIYQRGQDLLKTYPAASTHGEDEVLVAVLKEVIDAFAQPADVQSSLINQLLDGRKLSPEIQNALKTRLTRLNASEAEASAVLENARGLAKDGNWEGAQRLYVAIQHHPEWANTSARRTADQELIDGRTQQERIKTAQLELAKAIASGDIDKATEIARVVGLKYLPLVIDSLPRGAEVWHGGKRLGVTPMVLDVPAADRVDYNVELRMEGYLAKTMNGANALGGWRLIGALERGAVNTADLNAPVTSRPTLDGARIWAANRSSAFAIGPAGKVETFAFQGPNGPMPLNEPVYGGVTVSNNGVYIPSRENVAVRIGKTIERVPLASPTDFAIAIYESPELLDSRFLIVAGTDGAVHGVVEARSTQHWDGPAGSTFAAGPLVVGEQVLSVRSSGDLEIVRAYDGKKIATSALGAAVVSAWPTVNGFAGYTASEEWAWDGQTITRANLPQAAIAGALDTFIGINGRVWLKENGDWKDLGRVEGAVTGDPLAWQGHVAVPVGPMVHVFGPRGFSTTAATDFLSPVAVGTRLILISQDGKVQIFTP